MTHVDLSGTFLLNNFYSGFYEEVVGYLSDGKLTFSELVSLAGSLANKVHQFELLSAQEKHDVILRIVYDAKHQALLKNPSLSEDLNAAMTFLESVLPSVLESIAVASQNARLQKTDSWKQCLEVFRAVTCISCLRVEVPVVIPNKKKMTQLVKKDMPVEKTSSSEDARPLPDLLEPTPVNPSSNKVDL